MLFGFFLCFISLYWYFHFVHRSFSWLPPHLTLLLWTSLSLVLNSYSSIFAIKSFSQFLLVVIHFLLIVLNDKFLVLSFLFCMPCGVCVCVCVCVWNWLFESHNTVNLEIRFSSSPGFAVCFVLLCFDCCRQFLHCR